MWLWEFPCNLSPGAYPPIPTLPFQPPLVVQFLYTLIIFVAFYTRALDALCIENTVLKSITSRKGLHLTQ